MSHVFQRFSVDSLTRAANIFAISNLLVEAVKRAICGVQLLCVYGKMFLFVWIKSVVSSESLLAVLRQQLTITTSCFFVFFSFRSQTHYEINDENMYVHLDQSRFRSRSQMLFFKLLLYMFYKELSIFWQGHFIKKI